MTPEIPSIDSLGLSYVNSNIKSMELKPVRSEDFKVFSFSKLVSSEEAVREIEDAGYLPATLSELLVFVQKEGKQDCLVALGQSAQVGGDRGVPALWVGAGWHLALRWWAADWNSARRFLAVRNESLKLGDSEPRSQAVCSDTLSLELRIEKLERLPRFSTQPSGVRSGRRRGGSRRTIVSAAW